MGLRYFYSKRLLLVLSCLAVFSPSSVGPLSFYNPIIARAADEPADLEKFQGYLEEAPGGMDVRYAWGLPGGRGENVRIVDIEVNWNLKHNDLLAAANDLFISVTGHNTVPQGIIDHGTAVLGELIAADDGVGVTGIANRARLGLVNPQAEGGVPNAPAAIAQAASRLRPGDVLLVELQVAGPRFNPQNGRGLVPVEFEPGVFDEIKKATSAGIIVVEPSANGFENLDDPVYNGAFDRSRRDSGAIIVGAGMPPEGIYGPGPDLTRTEESNYGARVDLQGWGRFVTTCGYGDLRREQGENNWYTVNFGATSAAAAMVAGAAALVQSIVKEQGQTPLTPDQLRRLLVTTGTPQTGNLSEHIGPRPNLRAAIEALATDPQKIEPVIESIKFKKSTGKLLVNGTNFISSDSVIEIDGVPVSRMKYPSSYKLPNGTTARIIGKGNTRELLPPGVEVSITVFTPSTGKRSRPFLFRNQ